MFSKNYAEYLQQAAISSLSATTTIQSSTSVTTQNISNTNTTTNNNNQNNRFNNINGRGRLNEVNQPDCSVVDNTFENFDFDIELLTETKSKDQDKASLTGEKGEKQQLQPQMQLLADIQQTTPINIKLDNSIEDITVNNIEESEKEQQEKQQLQLMLDEILFGNNNQSCNNNIYFNNTYITTHNNNNNNNHTTKEIIPMANKQTIPMASNNMAELNNDENLFDFLPDSQMTYNDLVLDDLENFSPMLEEAVDINLISNEALSLDMNQELEGGHSDFLNSQGRDMWLSSGAALSQEIFEAEPHICTESFPYAEAEYYSQELLPLPSLSSQQNDYNEEPSEHTINCPFESIYGITTSSGDGVSKAAPSNPLKRNNSTLNKKHMQEKRSKLRLDTKCRNVPLKEEEEHIPLDTPGIVRLITEVNISQTKSGLRSLILIYTYRLVYYRN